MARSEKSKVKLFVLDTNVLVHDPEALYKFPHNQVIIPLTVLEELDGLKKASGEVGKNARAAIRHLVEAKDKGGGDFNKGVELPSHSLLRIVTEMKKDSSGLFDLSLNDNKILLTAAKLLEEGERVVFVSKDFE